MRERNEQHQEALKRSRFPMSLFVMYFLVLLLMSGIHIGLIVLMERLYLHKIIQCILPMFYWGLVAAAITLFTRRRIKKTYEEPLRNLAEATGKVANGDFSVYIPTINTIDRMDYLDIMILDFNKMVEELGSIQTLKTDFVSNVSHEMKTPISIIKNYAELLQKTDLSEEKRIEYAQSMEHAAVKLSHLITNILKLNKLENQKILPEPKGYDVCRQLCDSILQFEEVWERKGIEMDVDIEDVAYVYVDEQLMELVWDNLLSNALKFTGDHGHIHITQKSDESTVTVRIEDDGCGMSAECQKHLFDKFYQGDTSHSKEGNGLGLAMVKRVLDLLDGKITVISEEGKGSTFEVVMPLQKKE